MKRILLVILASSLSACASSTIVPEGPDSYMIYREGASGFNSTAPLKIDAIKEASAYCQKEGKHFRITRTNEIPGAPFRYPAAEVGFMCLKEGDPDLTRVRMEPAANTVIEVRK